MEGDEGAVGPRVRDLDRHDFEIVALMEEKRIHALSFTFLIHPLKALAELEERNAPCQIRVKEPKRQSDWRMAFGICHDWLVNPTAASSVAEAASGARGVA
ncbi:MAG: hypothetical protein DWQ53_09840 [Microcystis flos-aquae DF17]|nr:MAG: hypothetical protein DWQ53_09840 [Microcystis flos-aquae DF17]